VRLYVDASAFLKHDLTEPDRADCDVRLAADPAWVAAPHSAVEVRRNLARLLTGAAYHDARRACAADWRQVDVMALDEATCEAAARIAETTGCRTLDALHLAAAVRYAGARTFLTYDVRRAKAARALGLTVAGA
jgi:predicted nucleic acid-binding protein